MSEVDFSGEIERNPSLSQLDKWLSDAFQSPKPHDPGQEQSILSLAPSATLSVEPAKQSAVQEESPKIEERQINVEYVLFIASPKEKPSNSCLAKRKAPPEVEYMKFVSDAVSLGLYGGNRTQGYGGQLNEFQGKEQQEDVR
ncbi:hypothetical protein PCANC_13239 [Puccinia coronata f. sp. avenae]|uniref:Uncharacterized protein n=1 Tax=Puccinia coronata f. sp. avenae TaxID=200324 RepID=A0A2N5VER5_9BASI|nr:hypothetical protein PCANC_19880 [Puccinia coronata f. sp. avenae]PLW43565.1 hypothetical protein PCANC_13239 [Puccinia coronata f. sp. avenae]PLW48470.1 hypothetical protein PCASD_04255 [Puccinia coronata f. sp. avenae]